MESEQGEQEAGAGKILAPRFSLYNINIATTLTKNHCNYFQVYVMGPILYIQSHRSLEVSYANE